MSDSYALWQHLHQIHLAIETLTRKVEAMATELESLRAAVEKNTTVGESVVTLMKGMADEIRRLKPDAAEIAALAAKVDATAEAMKKAVTDNTSTPP